MLRDRGGRTARGFRPLLVAIALAAGCRAAHPPPALPPLALTDADAGRSVELALGQQLLVRLASNHSAGYGWSLAEETDAVVTLEQTPSYEESDATHLGAGGIETFRFEAVRTGEQTLRFSYRRPWERGSPAARTLSYTITVR
jgi:inhibitor of cysteine peptidase